MSPNETSLLNPPHGMSQPGSPTWEVAYLFPAQGEWDETEYLSLGTNWMVEFDNGRLEVLPKPTYAHQLIVDFLLEHLRAFVRAQSLGRVLFAPLPVKLASGKFREPDVVYLSEARRLSTSDYPEGANLVMEVLSEGATRIVSETSSLSIASMHKQASMSIRSSIPSVSPSLYCHSMEMSTELQVNSASA